MPSQLCRSLEALATVRGWIRQRPECDETTLSRVEREALAALRCVFAIIEKLQPVTVYGAIYADVYSALIDAQEALQEHTSEYTLVEYNLAFQALMSAFERVEIIHQQRSGG